MTHSATFARRPLRRRGLALALAFCLQGLVLQADAQTTPTTPSQNPLLSQGATVPPNMMVTLDTSWSMIFPYIPEGDVKLPGGTVKFPGFTSVIMHPADTRYDVGAGRGQGDGGAIPGDPGTTASVFQMQMRSPDVNSLYYDPRVTYKPWLIKKDSLDTDGQRYPNADATKALFDPDKTTGASANLTLVETARTAVWCNASPTTSGGKLACASSAKAFNPGLYYRLDGVGAGCSKSGGNPDPNDKRCYTKFDVNGSTGSFTKYTTRTDCLGSTCSLAEERQNFANWFVYYRTRLHIAQASIPETFLQLKDKKIRTGWATIHQGAKDLYGVSTRNVISGVSTMDATRKQDLVKWIRNFQSDSNVNGNTVDPKLQGRTPLLGAVTGVGDYFMRTDAHGPWANDPDKGDIFPNEALSCRRSYNVLITDGYYTDSSPKSQAGTKPVDIGNEDGKSGPTITQDDKSYTYTARPPYSDECSGTLADAAMYYWKNDLFPVMPNKVPAGKDSLTQDPAFWQHLTQFNIGLGVVGNIPYNDLKNELGKLSKGEKNWWPSASDPKVTSCSVTGNDPKLVDDLLHAAINSRGQYFSVKNPVELTTALTTALSRAGRQDGMTQSGIALQTLYLDKPNVKYVPEYTSEQWIGDVKAYETETVGTTTKWKTKFTWSAVEQLPAPNDRNIATWSGTLGVDFRWANIGTANQKTLEDPSTLPEGATGTDLINYIRGDTTKEDALQTLNLFRQRDSVIADFINSTPTLLKGNVYLQYDKLPTNTPGQDAYLDFFKKKKNRAPLLFVGDNGGMLHAFADYGSDVTDATKSKTRGQEVFAYVPQAAMPNLGKFAKRDYGSAGNPHRFFVDGPLTESDAYFGNDWHNVLVGTMGAGGRAIFAIDVTPGSKLQPTSVLWEKSSIDDEDFGYMLGDAQVGMLPDGSWKVFVGNGPYSKNGHAVLMMLDMAKGTITKVAVPDGSAGNGLGAVQLLKNSDQQVVGLYAGDLKGHMWRFDVATSGKVSTVSVGLSNQPLFNTNAGQPITAAPSIVPHPKGGQMVVFGTGKLFDDTDPDDTTLQAIYGVWDAPPSTASGTGSSNIKPADLVPQSIVTTPTATTTSGDRAFFDIAFTNVEYNEKRGWSIDLTLGIWDPKKGVETGQKGQRSIYPSVVVSDGYVLINTVVPARTDGATTCTSADGTGYSFLLPALMNGSYTNSLMIDTNGDGLVTDADKPASIYSTPTTGRSKVTVPDPEKQPGDSGSAPCSKEAPLYVDNHVNVGQVVGPKGGGSCKIRARIWRQIMNPPAP